jgi:uncharacterized SAM-binding protein YcdF (DUF218 family)
VAGEALAFIAVKAVLKGLFLPPTGLLLVALAGLIVLSRRPRLGRVLAWLGVGGLFALSIPFVAGSLHRVYAGATDPVDFAQAARAQAIVILGSGVRRGAPEYGGDTLGRYTLERVRYGARLARETGLPVLVSGGALSSVSTEAELMRDSLEQELGVPVRWVEKASRTTHENAQRSAEILRGAGVSAVVLVAHDVDMRRARAEFESAGLHIVPAPLDLARSEDLRPMDFLPGIGGLSASCRVLYEAAGELVRRLDAAVR